MSFFLTRYPTQDPIFVRNAYSWVKFHTESGTIRYAIEEIGNTRPGLVQQLRSPVSGLSEYELSTNKRRIKGARPHHNFVVTIHSDAEHWATAGALKSINNNPAVDPETTRDIPRTSAAKEGHVRLIVNAMMDMANKLDGDAREVKILDWTTVTVFEEIAWDFLVSSPLGIHVVDATNN